MIKFTLLALLCFSFSDEILGGFNEDLVGSDGYNLEIRYDDGVCCEDKNAPDASPEVEIACLNSKNSRLISDATLEVLYRADHSYEAIMALRIPEFMISRITYQEWADNILYGNHNFAGFNKLKQLVSKYVLCKKVCKVFFFLRESLREHAARADFDNVYKPNLGRFLHVSGDLIILGDVRKDIEMNFLDEKDKPNPFVGVIFECETLIIDSNLIDSKGWAGKLINIDAENVIVPKNYAWFVLGNEG